MLTIVDSGVANVASVSNMLRRLGITAQVSGDPDAVAGASRLIVPGIGAFDEAMSKFVREGLLAALNTAVLERGAPCLGICLGMQLMARGSEEGDAAGFGWVDARVVRFRFPESERPLKVPHMGWNAVQPVGRTALFAGLEKGARFYFVHSYYIVCERPQDVAAQARYGEPFTCAIEHNNIAGVQFHPEKSHSFGMQLLENFCRWNP